MGYAIRNSSILPLLLFSHLAQGIGREKVNTPPSSLPSSRTAGPSLLWILVAFEAVELLYPSLAAFRPAGELPALRVKGSFFREVGNRFN